MNNCYRCKKHPAAIGVKYCEDCRQYQRKRAQLELANPKQKQLRAERLRQWRKANPEKVKAQGVRRLASWKKKIYDHYGRTCTCCGEKQQEFLTLDHINNDGKEHRLRAGNNIYQDLITSGFPPIVQVMCWNCNEAKRIYGRCPHVKQDSSG